jgi:hypothetical protein
MDETSMRLPIHLLPRRGGQVAGDFGRGGAAPFRRDRAVLSMAKRLGQLPEPPERFIGDLIAPPVGAFA